LQEQRYVERKRLDPKAIAICKVQTTETLRDFANFAVHIRGAKGVLGNPTTLKVLNDAHAQCIYGGTSETMLEIVGSSLV
jgi:alkylation response protein AidB-like acyl-CoA dehydrogenase